MKSSTSGVSVSMSENGHSWSVSVPHTYQNQVTGLCGSCSSETCFGTEVEVSFAIKHLATKKFQKKTLL